MSFEELEVYRVAVELRGRVTCAIAGHATKDVREQFGRASSSVILSVAEGAGSREPADKRRCYVIARASAFETAAALTRLRAEAALSAEQYAAAKQRVIRVMAMLTHLAKRPVACAAGGQEVGR